MSKEQKKKKEMSTTEQPKFININHHLINLNALKVVKYWQRREMLEICLIDDQRFYFYLPEKESGFIMNQLQQAIIKRRERFDFYFTKLPPQTSPVSCFFPFFCLKKKKNNLNTTPITIETTSDTSTNLIFPDPVNDVGL